MLAVGVASNYKSTKTESIERHASITSLAKTTAGISDTDEANITISTPESHIIQVRSEYTSKSDGHIGSGDIELNDIEYTDFDDKDNGLVEHKFDFKGKWKKKPKGKGGASSGAGNLHKSSGVFAGMAVLFTSVFDGLALVEMF